MCLVHCHSAEIAAADTRSRIVYSCMEPASLNRSHSHGSLEPGKQGDFVVLNATAWEHLVYELVDPPIEAVYKQGKKVFGASH